MAKARQEQGASIKRGVLSIPSGTVEKLQFCKNGVIRLIREPKRSQSR